MRRFLVVSTLAGVASAALASGAWADDARIAKHLERLRTLERMSGFVARRPDGCVWASLRTELCSWILSKKDREAWKELSRLLHTRSEVGLICEFEVDGPGADNWCLARPREAEERRWRIKTDNERTTVPRLARATLAAARTIPQMSRLMGIGPDECRALEETEASVCTWHSDRNVYGHTLLTASVALYARNKVRLECRVPDDGSARADGSCNVSKER
jgi:hypothetical protein